MKLSPYLWVVLSTVPLSPASVICLCFVSMSGAHSNVLSLMSDYLPFVFSFENFWYL